MIRLTLLWLVVFGVLAYSWKDWYRGLCGLVVMMAIIEHPDMPKEMFGIPGLNPWNLMMLNILLAWLSQRRNEGLRWDMPRHITFLLLLYLGVVLVSFVRIIGDTAVLEFYYGAGMSYFINDYLVNTVKWVLPALLLYDGCRTEERFRLALFSVLVVYILLGIQVAKHMPPTLAFNAAELEHRGLRVLARNVGYHRVNLSAMLAGASWALLCTRVLMPRGRQWPILLAGLFVVYAQLFTGGRAGYGAWVAIGLVMCLLKWRRYLLLIPAAIVIVVMLAPGITGRALQGFTEESRDTSQRLDNLETEGALSRGGGNVDAYTVTAGRSITWPYVIAAIVKQPWIGYGRQAMLRSGVAMYVYETYREAFPHPHNAYLELLFDNGVVGAIAVLAFYALMLWYSVRMFLHKQSTTCIAAGGVATALMLSLLVSAFGSQSFYPREGWVGMWCAMFLMLRVRVEHARLAAAGAPAPAPEAVPVPRPGFARALPAPAAALARAPVIRPVPIRPSVAAAGPRVTWQPRGSNGSSPRPQSAAPPRRIGMIAPAIATWGLFGRRVSDPSVWERA